MVAVIYLLAICFFSSMYVVVVHLFSLIVAVSSVEFYPHGLGYGDSQMDSNQNYAFLNLTQPMLLFSIPLTQLQITPGLITVTAKRFVTLDIYNLFNKHKGGAVFFRESMAQPDLLLATNDVQKLINDKSFVANHSIIATFLELPFLHNGLNKKLFTYQVILASNSTTTYAILNYHRLDRHSATVGYKDEFCGEQTFITSKKSRSLLFTSNIGVMGRHVFLLTKECSQKDFYPYGEIEGHIKFRQGNNAEKFILKRPMMFLSNPTNSLFISADGIISVDEPIILSDLKVKYTLSIVTGIPIPTAFKAIFCSPKKAILSYGEIFYFETVNVNLTEKVTSDIQQLLSTNFTAHHVVIVTFVDMMLHNYFGLFTVQVIVAADATRSYALVTSKKKLFKKSMTSFGISEHYCNGFIDSKRYDSFWKGSYDYMIKKQALLLTTEKCRNMQIGFYPFGELFGDQTYTGSVYDWRNTIEYRKLDLKNQMFIYPFMVDNVYVHYDGDILFDTKRPKYFTNCGKDENFCFQEKHQLKMISRSIHSILGHIYYRVIVNEKLLQRASMEIGDFTSSYFVANHALVVTYDKVETCDSCEASYQVVFVSNETDTFVVIHYQAHKGCSDCFVSTRYYVPACGPLTLASGMFDKLAVSNTTGIKGMLIRHLTMDCHKADFYPYGRQVGDNIAGKQNQSHIHFRLYTSFIIFNRGARDIFISENGVISINKPINQFNFSFPNEHTIIIPYGLNMTTNENGLIYYRESNDSKLLLRAETQIKKFSVSKFKASKMIIVTYVNLSYVNRPKKKHDFQVLLVTNSTFTYGILLHQRLDMYGAVVGFSDGFCHGKWLNDSVNSRTMQSSSNIGEVGVHVVPFTNSLCKQNVTDLYAFGKDIGDSVIQTIHSTEKMNLSIPFLFFSSFTDEIYISKYGAIGLSIPTSFHDEALLYKGTFLYIYYNDVLYKDSFDSSIYYRETFDQKILEKARSDINLYDSSLNFKPLHAVIVTYFNTRMYFDESEYLDNSNVYQAMLVSDGNNTFAILSYPKLYNYFTVAAFTEDFCGKRTFSEVGKSLSLSLTSNIGVPGRHVYLLTRDCRYSKLFPYGEHVGDELMRRSDNGYEKMIFTSPMILTGKPKAYIYINVNGFISEDYGVTGAAMIIPSEHTIVVAYSIDLDTTNAGFIYYRETKDKVILQKLSTEISAVYPAGFVCKRAVVISYVDVPTQGDSSAKHTMQMVLATDEEQTFTIWIYKQLDTPNGVAGYSINECKSKLLKIPSESHLLVKDSNVGIRGMYIRKLTSATCLGKTRFYSWGPTAGDTTSSKGDRLLPLHKSMRLFSKDANYLYVSQYGHIVVNKRLNAKSVKVPYLYTILSAYTRKYCLSCLDTTVVYYREVFDSQFLSDVSISVRLYSNSTFNGTHAFVASWLNVGEKRNIFQAVIITDDSKTYAVLTYTLLRESHADAASSDIGCPSSAKVFMPPERSDELQFTSNIGVRGRHVFLLTGDCDHAELYPFGKDSGDTVMQPGNDHVEHLVLQKPMKLFSNPAKDVFISVNGMISVNKPVNDSRILMPFGEIVLVPYGLDLDITTNGQIYYREDSSTATLDKASKDVERDAGFRLNLTNAIVVTYVDVPLKDSQMLKHTFQAVIVSDGRYAVAILNYMRLDSSGAIVGFSDGLCNHGTFKHSSRSYEMTSVTNVGVVGQYIRRISSHYCEGDRSVAYPFGEKNGDNVALTGVNLLYLVKPFLFFSTRTWEVVIGERGFVAVDPFFRQQISFPRTAAFFAVYGKDLSTRRYGSVYYRDIYDPSQLAIFSQDIKSHTGFPFNVSYAILVTYHNVRLFSTNKYTHNFQAAFVTDEYDTYAILKYFRLDTNNALVGFSERFCSEHIVVESSESWNLEDTSNTGIPGQHIFKLTSTTCKQGEVYPYGEEADDTVMLPGDEYYEHLVLNQSFPLFSTLAKDIYIHVNGFLSINEPVLSTAGVTTAEYTVIAPYFLDMDTTESGKIYYRESFDLQTLKNASRDVMKNLSDGTFSAQQVVVVTFEAVPSKGGYSFTQSFQIVLATNGTVTFAIINYIDLNTPADVTGFSEKYCDIFPLSNVENDHLTTDSNVDYKGQYVFQLTKDICNGIVSDLYPFGAAHGHTELGGYDNKAYKFTLKRNMLLFSETTKYVAVNTNGVITINTVYSSRKVSLPYSGTVLAPYGLDFDTREGGAIYFGETQNKAILERANKDVQLLTNHSFDAGYAIITSYVNVPKYKDSLKRYTFQVVIASDGNKTYAILNYKRLDTSDATVGYSEPFCGWKLFSKPENSRLMVSSSNVGVPGKHVYLLTAERCSRSELYPFGINVGDSSMAPGDNTAALLQLQKPMLLFSRNATNIYINTNGIVSVNSSVLSAIQLPYYHAVVALYHLDYDTTEGGRIYYRETTDNGILEMAQLDVEKYESVGFRPSRAVVVTYIDMPLKNHSTQRNTFQLILVSNNTLTYGVFNYKTLDSTNAVTGFSEPLCYWMTFKSMYFDYQRYSHYLSQTSNIAVEGKFVFILTEASCADSDGFQQDAPRDLQLSRLGYDFLEMKWTHEDSGVESHIRSFPYHYVAYVTSAGDWDSRVYKFSSRFARIDALKQNKTYHVVLYTERRGLFFLSGHYAMLENIKVLQYEPVFDARVIQAGSEALLTWKTPDELIQDIVTSNLLISYAVLGESPSDFTLTMAICEKRFSFTGDVGSVHSVKISPVVDETEGPIHKLNYTFVDDSVDDSDGNLILITSVSSAAFVAILTLLFIFKWYHKTQTKKFNAFLLTGSNAQLDPDRSILEQCNNLPYDTNFEFKRQYVSLVRILGEGAFGQVWMATALNMDHFKPRMQKKRTSNFFNSIRSGRSKKTVVAVKTLKGNAGKNEYRDLANELKLLIHVGEHRNVVNLLGACTKSSSLLVILEYCALGSLLSYVRLIRDEFQPVWAQVDGKNLHEMTWICVQIANGMTFLEGQKCVHRDLAARNILLTGDMIAKISDFGLARGTDSKDYYKKDGDGLLPIKWMSPEAILEQKYTSKSDAWSFGVVLWEVYSLGFTPYPGIKNSSIISYLKSGKRMLKPNSCPVEVYELMMQCWSAPTEMRPNFLELRNNLDRVIVTNEKVFNGQSMASVYDIKNTAVQVEASTDKVDIKSFVFRTDNQVKHMNSEHNENNYALNAFDKTNDDYVTLKNTNDDEPVTRPHKKTVTFQEELLYVVFDVDDDEGNAIDELSQEEQVERRVIVD